MRVVIVALALILCACAPAYNSGDPYQALVYAERLGDAAGQAIAQTQAAGTQAAAQATATRQVRNDAATATVQAHNWNTTATACAISLEATGAAARMSALETQKAATIQAANTSEAYRAQAQASTATATAQAAAIEHQRNIEIVGSFTRFVVLVFALFIAGLAAWVFAVPAMEARRRKSWVMLDSHGRVVAVFVPNAKRFLLPHELTNTWSRPTMPQLQEPDEPKPPQVIDPPHIRLLKDAAALGELPDGQFPGYRALKGWSSDAWQAAVKVLVDGGYVRTVADRGTYYNNGWSLDRVFEAYALKPSSLVPGREYHPAERKG